MMETEINLSQFVGKDILAWMFIINSEYSSKNRCYVNPRYVLENNTWQRIDPYNFPTRGSIDVRIQEGETVYNLIERTYGKTNEDGVLVRIKINTDQSIFIDDYTTNQIVLKYSYRHGENNSQIWIDRFPGYGFYQIVKANTTIESLNNSKDRALSIDDSKIQIYTTKILVNIGDSLYGPFEYDIHDGIVHLKGSKALQYMIGEYDIGYNRYVDNLCSIKDQDNNIRVELLPQSELKKTTKQLDWIEDERLLGAFINAMNNGNVYTREQIRQIRNAADNSIKNSTEVLFTEERIKRIKELLAIHLREEDVVTGVVKYALEDKDLSDKLLEDIANNHFDSFYSSYKNKFPQIAIAEQKASELEKQVKELEKKINAANIPHKNAVDNEELDLLNTRIKALTDENTMLKMAVQDYKSTIGDIDGLKKQKEKLAEDTKIAWETLRVVHAQQNEAEDQIKTALRNFGDELSNKVKMTAKAIDVKMLDRILRSVEGEIETEASPIKCLSSNRLNQSITREEIINRVEAYIRDKAHREVSYNDVANYLICITQGFITTFAGEPGTGKTSLCNILAKSLGLCDQETRRFVDISVERGWTSHKDFIGYYNPLTKRMEKSNAEVFDAFTLLDLECGSMETPYDPNNVAPFLILLDEANLSPIEHYWAPFLRNCDFNSTTNRTISLGGNNNLRLPDHLRFLATVNFDHTTEELSPRFLDRSWVITLEPSLIDDIDEETIENADSIVSFDSLRRAFMPDGNSAIEEPIMDKWNAIQAIFRDDKCGMPISPRNIKMIKNYCVVACKCMILDSPQTKYAPLDYALSQKILPTINGTGDNYKMLIEELSKECSEQNMPITATHLKRMRRVAENNIGYYQFFGH